jgi:hypothetical protein
MIQKVSIQAAARHGDPDWIETLERRVSREIQGPHEPTGDQADQYHSQRVGYDKAHGTRPGHFEGHPRASTNCKAKGHH